MKRPKTMRNQVQLATSPSAVVMHSGGPDCRPVCEPCANVATTINPRRKPIVVRILAIVDPPCRGTLAEKRRPGRLNFAGELTNFVPRLVERSFTFSARALGGLQPGQAADGCEYQPGSDDKRRDDHEITSGVL